MSEDTFQPFVPPAPMFEEGKAALPPPPVHEKKARKKRSPIAARATKKAKREARHARVDATPVTPFNMPKPATKKARKAKQPRALKLDVATAMAISAELKPTDFKVFESVVETLQAINKAVRARVLAAGGRVFE